MILFNLFLQHLPEFFFGLSYYGLDFYYQNVKKGLTEYLVINGDMFLAELLVVADERTSLALDGE